MSTGKIPFYKDARLIIVLIILAVFGLVFAVKGQKKIDTAEQILPPVKVVKPFRGPLQKTFQLNGYIESESMVTVLPRVSGILKEISVDVGDRVYKGQQVAFVDNESLQLTLNQAEAGYTAAKSSYDRIKQMFDAGAATKQNFDQAKAQFDAAESQYALAKLQVSFATVTSPISGVVLIRHVTGGSMVAPTVPIITVGDLKHLVIKARIPEKYYEAFLLRKDAMPVFVKRPDSEMKAMAAVISSISPYISAETKNFEVVCRFRDQSPLIKPGMFVYISFVLSEKKAAYSVPFQSLVANNEIWYVEPDTFTARKIAYKPVFYNDEFFEVDPAYKDYLFVTEGQYFIQEGQKVNIINKEDLK